MAPEIPPTTYSLGDLTERVDTRLASWDANRYAARLWAKDHRLWSAEELPELTDRLGWLWLPGETDHLDDIEEFARTARADTDRVVLLGMGGSSLAPEVFQSTFGNAEGCPELVVLDSTHPDAVHAVRVGIDLERTLFVVASKSGGTIETLSLFRYFWGQVSAVSDHPGSRFVALTDPGSGLEEMARNRGFRRIFRTPPEVGGRYSALTSFGLLPAALIGMDIRRFLARAVTMAKACGPAAPASRNPALRFGAAIGEAALAGRDKLTFVCSPSVAAFGTWMEQLVAESTGKNGTGIVPVVGEPLGKPSVYGDDRVFVHLASARDEAPAAERASLDALRMAGHPVIRIVLGDRNDLGAEVFRAEMAVAAAGSVLRINPFNQPDVQVAKNLAKQAMSPEGLGATPDEVSTDDQALLERSINAWRDTVRTDDYIGIHAYLPMNEPAKPILERMAVHLRDRSRVAVTLGYGPRFLHSTGQLHKGGAANGLFLQIVDRPAREIAVPEAGFTFAKLIEGQAAGDFQALSDLGRRVLRIRLGADTAEALARLESAALTVTGTGRG